MRIILGEHRGDAAAEFRVDQRGDASGGCQFWTLDWPKPGLLDLSKAGAIRTTLTLHPTGHRNFLNCVFSLIFLWRHGGPGVIWN